MDMRKWYKYSLANGRKGLVDLPIDQTFEDHAQWMGQYEADEAYASKESFFAKYFFGYHLKRLEYYDDFIRKAIDKDARVLSIASGRAANELYMMESGYGDITCSDLSIPSCYEAARRLFPNLRFVELDILERPAPAKYGAVICLSLIYLFDSRQLLSFFQNVSQSLESGGHLILDSAGAPDNLPAYLIHDVLLKYEMVTLKWATAIAKGKRNALVRKHHGYRRTDREIVGSAELCGFKLRFKQNYAFLNEWKRSIVLDKLIRSSSLAEKAFHATGKIVPYVRMFDFQKLA